MWTVIPVPQTQSWNDSRRESAREVLRMGRGERVRQKGSIPGCRQKDFGHSVAVGISPRTLVSELDGTKVRFLRSILETRTHYRGSDSGVYDHHLYKPMRECQDI